MTGQMPTSAPVAIAEKDLNAKVMSLLRERPSCIDARSVMLYLVDDGISSDNWRIGHFDPGTGDRYKCKLALRAIHASLSGQFLMVGES